MREMSSWSRDWLHDLSNVTDSRNDFVSVVALHSFNLMCSLLGWSLIIAVLWQVIQMVSLMDRLLKLENLDLQLTAYGVLATGPDEGMVEFVPSISLAQVRVSFSLCILLSTLI